MDCPYTFMQDMVAGTYRLPWEDEVRITDGTSCGFPAPTRMRGAGGEGGGVTGASLRSALAAAAEVRPAGRETRGHRLAPLAGYWPAAYFGGCSPGLLAHFSRFSSTRSWLGRFGGLESLGERWGLMSLVIGLLLPPQHHHARNLTLPAGACNGYLIVFTYVFVSF